MNKMIPYLISLLITTSSVQASPGAFSSTLDATDYWGNEETLYHFHSTNDEVWWLLSPEDIGFTPNLKTKYVLVYDNMGTTKENYICNECLPEWTCECYLYDDEFIGLFEIFE